MERLPFILLLVPFAAPTMAENLTSAFRTEVINGVRVWSPRPSLQPIQTVPVIEQHTVIIEQSLPADAYEPIETYLPYGIYRGRFHRLEHPRPEHRVPLPIRKRF